MIENEEMRECITKIPIILDPSCDLATSASSSSPKTKLINGSRSNSSDNGWSVPVVLQPQESHQLRDLRLVLCEHLPLLFGGRVALCDALVALCDAPLKTLTNTPHSDVVLGPVDVTGVTGKLFHDGLLSQCEAWCKAWCKA